MYKIQMHGHNFFELAYITGGTAEHTLENEGKTISAGDYFFVDYGCLHGFQNCKNLTLINCLFLPETVDETLQGCRSFSQLLQGLSLIHIFFESPPPQRGCVPPDMKTCINSPFRLY